MAIIKRKLIIYLFIFILIFTSVQFQSISVFANTDIDTVISVESVSALPGQTVEVKISISNNPGILGAKLNLSYGSDLTLKSVKQGDALSTLAMTKPGKMESPCSILWDGISEADNQNGTIATLTFDVSSDAEAQNTIPIQLSYKSGGIVDNDVNPVSVTIKNGGVNVVTFTPGDVNSDDDLNVSDVISLRRNIAGGYNLQINYPAADVNDDGSIDVIDVISLRRALAGGYGVTLLPSHYPVSHYIDLDSHIHSMEHFDRKEAKCITDGTIEYWHCTECDKYFTDSEGNNEVSEENLTIPNLGGHSPNSSGTKCTVCGENLLQNEYSITYDLTNGDEYLENQSISNPNKDKYKSDEGLTLEKLSVPGYRFLGWYDESGNQISKIEKGSTGGISLTAHWKAIEYEVKFAVSMINDSPSSTEPDKIKSFKYTVDKGATIQPLKMDTYTFVGWSDQNGKFYQNNVIPIGTTGDIILNDNWVSQRNMAKPISKLEDPLIIEDTDNSLILFCYEIGTIENVPLYETQSLNSVNGIISIVEKTTEHSLEESEMKSVASKVLKETEDSTHFTLSKEITDITTVSEKYITQTGKDRSVAEEEARSQTNTQSFSSSVSNSNENYLYNDSTSTVSTNENYVVSENAATGTSAELTTSIKNTTDFSLGVSLPIECLNVSAGVKNSTEIGATAKTSEYFDYSTGSTSSWNKDTYDSSCSAASTTNNKSWNTTSGSSSAATVSKTSTVSETLHELISNEYGYGKTYSEQLGNSETRGVVSTNSEETDTSTTIAYSNKSLESHTVGFQTTGNTFGGYRLIMAGTLHVFAVVCYDIENSDYFVYTYNVLGDGSQNDGYHEIIDYSYDRTFNDFENSIIPFEIPKFVDDYVNSRIIHTDGLEYDFNHIKHTATVDSYNGNDKVVIVPSYFVDDEGTAFKVTGMNSNVFAQNKNIEAISLGKNISEIPDNAFKGCESLEYIVCPSVTKIGNQAFAGCTSLKEFKVSNQISYLGEQAFENVPEVVVEVGYDAENASAAKLVAENAASSGAKSINLNISNIPEDCELNLIVGSEEDLSKEINPNQIFVLDGNNKNFENLNLESYSKNTELRNISLNGCSSTPIKLYSDEVKLYGINIVNCNTYGLLLGKDNTTLTLSGTNIIESIDDDAMLCRNLNITYNNSGKLKLSGNLLICGNVLSNIDRISFINERGTISYINEVEFNKFKTGVVNVTLDPGEGTLTESTFKAYYGKEIGVLPTPKRDYYTFEGWYTEVDGGEKIESTSVISNLGSITLYAHWKQHDVSDWVSEDLVPDGAQITDTKWTIDSSSSNVANFTLTGSDWKWSDYGAWSGWSDNPVYSSESREVGTQTVYASSNYKTQYVYYHYREGATDNSINQGGTYCEHVLDSPLNPVSYNDGCGFGSATHYHVYNTICPYVSSGHFRCVFYLGTRQAWISDNYKTQYRYRDRSKIYTYHLYKVVSGNDTNTPSGSGISNVKKMVKYREQ